MTDPVKNLVDSTIRLKVSSVLNKDTTNFGKQFLVDGNDETCWNSDQGKPQFILIDFGRSVIVKELVLQFQGGFVGKQCQAFGCKTGTAYEPLLSFYPDDNNMVQRFPVLSPERPIEKLKLVFEDSTDFFGRVTVYKLEVLGMEAS
ncbi:uncharacterized protein VTP21DRAFT_1658 [Calcarisporiella thermophila]|uniref:uncharacterized protein n=1 Tax=Calcarisporiella thermophila TaxID=911321 RepID=UPI003742D1E5